MRKNSTLWLLLGTALLPVAAAAGLYFSGLAGELRHQSNRGELVLPVKTLAEWGGNKADHTGKWTLLLTPAPGCDASCQTEQLESLRAVHNALGRNAGRVRVALKATAPAMPGTGVWLVDPLGNLVLHYPQAAPRDTLHDLRRLLRLSGIG
ncbi:hypothetical protein Q4485_11980 [Granulosicoccaceae sp. 1_MG-2023]|nr:hypothetical protein [Granulosicoccaceae sp. 1_MG-2023]